MSKDKNRKGFKRMNKRILSLAIALIMLMAMAAPAMAEAVPKITDGKVQFNKDLKVEDNAVIRDVNFEFTLSAVDAAKVGSFLAQTSSLDGITVSAATGVNNTDVQYDANAGKITVSYHTADKNGTDTDTTKTKGFVVDFSGIDWTGKEPGVYRYKIQGSSRYPLNLTALADRPKLCEVANTAFEDRLIEVARDILIETIA